MVTWTVPENVETQVTLFRDSRHAEYEDKEWTFLLEDVNYLKKNRIFIVMGSGHLPHLTI